MKLYKVKIGTGEYQIVASNAVKAIELAKRMFLEYLDGSDQRVQYAREHPDEYIHGLEECGIIIAIENIQNAAIASTT